MAQGGAADAGGDSTLAARLWEASAACGFPGRRPGRDRKRARKRAGDGFRRECVQSGSLWAVEGEALALGKAGLVG